MKKVVKYLIVSVLLFMIPISVSAHPGGLDASGCHTCRTNCAKYGLTDGQYHCHNGNSNSSRGSSESYNITTKTTTVKKVYGCTNSSAINYNSNANVSDGSCNFEQIETKKETITYETKVDGDAKTGYKNVVKEGQNGEKEVTIKKVVNEFGEEISREVISETIIKEPVDEVVVYSDEENKLETKADGEEANDDGIILIAIILLIINIIYGNKNKNAKIIINQIKKVPIWLRFILYFLYFIFIIPVFIDIVLVIIDLIAKKRTK